MSLNIQGYCFVLLYYFTEHRQHVHTPNDTLRHNHGNPTRATRANHDYWDEPRGNICRWRWENRFRHGRYWAQLMTRFRQYDIHVDIWRCMLIIQLTFVLRSICHDNNESHALNSTYTKLAKELYKYQQFCLRKVILQSSNCISWVPLLCLTSTGCIFKTNPFLNPWYNI